MKLIVDFSPEGETAVKRLMQATGSKDLAELINNALTLTGYDADQVASGRRLGAVDQAGHVQSYAPKLPIERRQIVAAASSEPT